MINCTTQHTQYDMTWHITAHSTRHNTHDAIHATHQHATKMHNITRQHSTQPQRSEHMQVHAQHDTTQSQLITKNRKKIKHKPPDRKCAVVLPSHSALFVEIYFWNPQSTQSNLNVLWMKWMKWNELKWNKINAWVNVNEWNEWISE